MRDHGHEAADTAVEEWRAEVVETFRQAQEDAKKQLDEFMEKFAEQDAKKREKVDAGDLSEKDYAAWRRVNIASGKRYADMLDQLSEAYANANEAATAALAGKLPEVYAENANFAAYQVCQGAGADVSFSLVDAWAVQEALTKGDALLPVPSHDRAKDKAWNRKLVASQLSQGIMLGESIPTMAKRVENVTGSNAAAATRTARTYATAAENAGRVSSYGRAKAMGIDLKQEWVATLDNRTRHSHRQLDGEQVEVGAKFSNGCRFPGDPAAPHSETMNCRCTLVAAVAGFDTSDAKRWSRLPKGTSYERWKGEKAPGYVELKHERPKPAPPKEKGRRGKAFSEDRLADKLESYVGGGYDIDDLLTDEDKSWMREREKTYGDGLWRIEHKDFTARKLDEALEEEEDDEFAFGDGYRSFTHDRKALESIAKEFSDFDDLGDYVVFQVNGDVKGFDMEKYAEAYTYDQKEVLVRGRFAYGYESHVVVNGTRMRVIHVSVADQ